PVDSFFSESFVPRQKANRLIAVGRWDSTQKDGKLLAASLNRYYERGGTAETLIFGNGCDVFSRLSSRWGKVECRGVQSPSAVAQAMSGSRSLLLTSRWEGAPVVAFEALCQGCTIVSTDIPNAREFVDFGRFGEISPQRTP